ncbi:hypothetical protein [Aquibacillus rhizosphaerae]|uniref:Uncharacterized protein n=1 Tax=Aquibacillus rhizosphaerae TaxID=3051431 RepID=A0ABT7L9P7_9BACI|nr:hypothetical protein [Aquibacillus sp. LR5S19]MDL4842594.1 hypothetical protein [Aquibacillus sp. LR5S19]
MNLGQEIILDVVAALKELYPDIGMENTKYKLSTVQSKYYIHRVELGEVHPALKCKIQLFIW